MEIAGPLHSGIESCVLYVTDNKGAIVTFVHARLFKFHFSLSIIREMSKHKDLSDSGLVTHSLKINSNVIYQEDC